MDEKKRGAELTQAGWENALMRGWDEREKRAREEAKPVDSRSPDETLPGAIERAPQMAAAAVADPEAVAELQGQNERSRKLVEAVAAQPASGGLK